MSNIKLGLKWKITKVLDTTPPIHQDNCVFNISPNPGLYNQLSIPMHHSYVPQILLPTLTYHQLIKNNLRKIKVKKIDDKKFPYNIYVPAFNTSISFNLKIRLFPPNILSLTVTLSNFTTTLDAAKLIDYQKIEQLKPINDIIQWTIGIVETLNHKNFVSSQTFRYKPAVHLGDICPPKVFQNYIKGNIHQLIGVLIRNYDYEQMKDEIPKEIIKKNNNHNLKSSGELLLIDKQGVLYITPLNSKDSERQKKTLSRTHDLYEIANVFSEYLNNYLSFRCQNEDLADFFLYKIRPWINEPEVIFRNSITNKNIWNLLVGEQGLKPLMQSVTKSPILRAIEDKSNYFDLFSIKWWNENDFPYLLSRKIEESKELNLTFLDNEDLERLIIEDYGEARRSLQCKNYKATILLCGSIVEAILTAAIAKAKIPGITSEKLYEVYNLHKLIELAKNESIITDSNIFSFIDPLRNYRNTIHPGVQVRKSVSLDLSKARIAIETIKLLIKELNKSYKN